VQGVATSWVPGRRVYSYAIPAVFGGVVTRPSYNAQCNAPDSAPGGQSGDSVFNGIRPSLCRLRNSLPGDVAIILTIVRPPGKNLAFLKEWRKKKA
jgi:hypothetical protein